MMQHEIQAARRANLAQFLECNYPYDIISCGRSICLKNNHSLSIKRSVGGYFDFATGEHGNAVDFLTSHLKYNLPDAVKALLPFAGVMGVSHAASASRGFHLPESASQPFHTVEAYLSGRAIPKDCIDLLISRNILYQDSPYSNAVFVTPERDYCEIRGTRSGVKFHGCRKTSPNRFWYFQPCPDEHPKMAYICEAAIDAISLYLICVKEEQNVNAVFISIGGVSNQAAIDRIKSRMQTVLAVDNDEAGSQCRLRNSDLKALIPIHKDWNEDLMHY